MVKRKRRGGGEGGGGGGGGGDYILRFANDIHMANLRTKPKFILASGFSVQSIVAQQLSPEIESQLTWERKFVRLMFICSQLLYEVS